MKCPQEDIKTITIVQQFEMNHKVLVEELPNKTDALTFFRNMDFSLPMDYNTSSVNF